MQHDPLADTMSILKNATDSGKMQCTIRPSSKLIGRVLKVMQENNYIGQFEYVEDGRAGMFRVELNGNINDCGVVKPRFSVKKRNLEEYEEKYLPAQDFGVLIISTTRGVMTQRGCRDNGTGGKLLAFVY